MKKTLSSVLSLGGERIPWGRRASTADPASTLGVNSQYDNCQFWAGEMSKTSPLFRGLTRLRFVLPIDKQYVKMTVNIAGLAGEIRGMRAPKGQGRLGRPKLSGKRTGAPESPGKYQTSSLITEGVSPRGEGNLTGYKDRGGIQGSAPFVLSGWMTCHLLLGVIP